MTASERTELGRIADELAESDPEVAACLSRSGFLGWWPVSARSTAGLVLGLAVLVLAAQVIPRSNGEVLAVLTILVVLPWVLHAATSRRSRCRRTHRADRGDGSNRV